jgi:ethanolamine utilization microcompartment shell protein EutL
MSWFPRPVSPRAAIADLLAFMRHSSREQRVGAALAILVTAIIVIEFLVDAKLGTAPPPQVTYVDLYPSNRTDAEIIADQKKDQAAKEAAQKERQRQFQKLENQLGL